MKIFLLVFLFLGTPKPNLKELFLFLGTPKPNLKEPLERISC